MALFYFGTLFLLSSARRFVNVHKMVEGTELLNQDAESLVKERQLIQKTLLSLNLMVMKKMNSETVENKRKVGTCTIKH